MPEIEKPFRKTGDAAISESPLHPRRKSRRIMVGPVPVGGGAPISVQSMTNTLTADVPATLQQIAELPAAGCDIVRVAVPSQDDADALPEIVKKSPIPVIADIHFQSKYVIRVLDSYFWLRRPKISAEGKATIWVSSSASSKPVVSSPSAVP